MAVHARVGQAPLQPRYSRGNGCLTYFRFPRLVLHSSLRCIGGVRGPAAVSGRPIEAPATIEASPWGHRTAAKPVVGKFDRDLFERLLVGGQYEPLIEYLEDYARQRGGGASSCPPAAAAALQRPGAGGRQQQQLQQPAAEEEEGAQGVGVGEAAASALLQQRRRSHQHASSSSSSVPGSSPAAAAAAAPAAARRPGAARDGRRAVSLALRGQHQRLFRRLLREAGPGPSRLALARRYLRLLPPEPRVFTGLMRECTLRRDVDALAALLEERSACGLARDAYCYSALVGAAANSGDLAGARAAFTEALVTPGCANTILCNVAAGAFLRAGDYEAVFDVHDRMLSAGVEPDTVTANTLLAAAGAARRPARVRELLQAMLPPAASQGPSLQQRPQQQQQQHTGKSAGLPSEAGADGSSSSGSSSGDGNAATAAAAAAGGIATTGDGGDTLTDVASSSSSSSSVTSSSSMVLMTLPSPDEYTYSLLFKAVAQDPEAYSGDWLIEAYNSMQYAHVSPNQHVLTSFLAAASAVDLSPPQLSTVFAALDDCRAARLCSGPVYTAALALCARHGNTDRALDVWYAVLEDGVRCTGRLYSALFSAAASGASPSGGGGGGQGGGGQGASSSSPRSAATGSSSEMQDLVLRAYQRMVRARKHAQQQGQQRAQQVYAAQRSGSIGGAPRKKGRAGDGIAGDGGDEEGSMLVAYNALLHYFAKVGEVGQAAAVYGAMASGSGPAPDEITFNTMIAAYGGVGDLESSIRLFSDMQALGLSATPRTYVALMDACAKGGRRDVAERLMGLMRGAGLQPSVQTYTALMDACVKDGSADALRLAFSLLDGMRSCGVAPTAVTYGCLLQACEATQDVERAFELYRQACEEGVLPTDECHNVLIKVCIRAQRLDEALDLVKSLARCHGSMQQPMLNSLIRALAGPYPDRALRLMYLMRARRMEPNRGTFLAMIGACANDGSSSVALSLYRQLRSGGHEPSSQAGSALVSSLCKANDLGAARWVFEDMVRCAQGAQQQQPGVGAKRPPGSARVGPGGGGDRSAFGSGLPRRSLLPSTSATASVVEALTREGRVGQALEYFGSIKRDERRLAPLALSHRRMWESLIEACCRRNDIGAALEVFDKWKAACMWLIKTQQVDGAPAAVGATAAAAAPPPAGAGPQHPQHPPQQQQQTRRAVAPSPPSGPRRQQQRDRAGAASAAFVPHRQPPLQPHHHRHHYPKLSNVTLAFLEACCRRDPAHEWRVYDVCAEMRQAKERKLQAQLARPRKASHHFLDGDLPAMVGPPRHLHPAEGAPVAGATPAAAEGGA